MTRTPERAYDLAGTNGPVPVIEQGSGPAIVIVHGGSGDATVWSGVADRLAEEFRVLRYTRPIYRWNPPPHRAEAVVAELADALSVARSAGEPALVVGHSSGAVVALEAALTDAEAFAALAIYEPPLDVTHTPAGRQAIARARVALEDGERLRAMRIHLRDLVGMPRRVVVPITLLPPVRRSFRRYAAGQTADNEMLDALPEGLERFRALELPVLLITGEKSPRHLQTRSSELAALLPEVAGQVTLAGQRHGANVSAPDALADTIRAFARQVLG